MFPLPIEKLPRINQYRYRLFLYLSVILWLLPLIAIMLVSLRSLSDLNAGNYWGIPTELNFFENYSEVFVRSPMATYFLNSLIISITFEFLVSAQFSLNVRPRILIFNI